MVSSRWVVGGGLLLSAVALATGPRVPTHVACVGDSITVGYGADAGMSYPDQLQTLLGTGVAIGHFGHSGATMLRTGDLPYIEQQEYQDAQNFVSTAGPNAVVDVIIMLGTNDSKPYNWTPDGGAQSAQYASDALAMATVFANLPTHPVVYLAYPPWAAQGGTACCNISGPVIHDQIIPVITQVATQAGLPIIDVNTATTPPPDYFEDGVHPNDRGALLIAQLMQSGIARVPSITLTAPEVGATVFSPVAFVAVPDAGSVLLKELTFYADGVSVGSSTQAPYVFSAGLAPGEHSVEAEVTDTTGASARSAAVAFTVLAPAADAGTPGQPTSDGGVLAPPVDNLIIHSGCSAWPVLSALPLALAALWLRRSARAGVGHRRRSKVLPAEPSL